MKLNKSTKVSLEIRSNCGLLEKRNRSKGQEQYNWNIKCPKNQVFTEKTHLSKCVKVSMLKYRASYQQISMLQYKLDFGHNSITSPIQVY